MKPTVPRTRLPLLRGFSLIELLVVMGVIALLMALTIPTSRFLSSAELEQGVELFQTKLSIARQTAIKLNHPIEVRFYSYEDPLFPDDGEEFRAIQYFRHEVDIQTGEEISAPISRVERLPRSIVVLNDPRYSTLVSAAELLKTDSVEISPEVKEARYSSFLFLPNGSAELSDTEPGAWFLTLVEKNRLLAKSGELPSNYVVLQIEPFTGAIRRIQPRAG